MKRNIFALLMMAFCLVSVTSCTKDADVETISQKLPKIQLSSLGLNQTGPFAASSVLQFSFGATTTNATPTTFKVEILDGSTVVKTVNFTSWSGKDDTSTGTTTNHTISFTTQPTTFPNTQVYSGSILLKLSVLGLTSGKTYGVKAYANGTDSDNKAVTTNITQTGFFKVS